VCLLASALMYVTHPGYHAFLLRKTYPDLAKPGGLIPMSHEWLSGTDAHWAEVKKCWTFPSGATLNFGHLSDDRAVYNYQGSAASFWGFDELTQLSDHPYLYLFSRLRQTLELTEAGIPLRMRAATNPGGPGAEWVKERFISGVHPDRLFVPSTHRDNPHLDHEEYAKALAELDPVTRAQLQDGNWDIQAQGNMFSPSDIKVREGRLPDAARRCRVWDLATGNEKSDWTVGTLMAIHEGQIRIEHVWREKAEPGRMEKAMAKMAEIDGRHVPILIEQERGSAGTLYLGHIKRDVLKGYTVVAQTPTGHKEDRAMHASALASQGRIEMTEASWNQAALSEMSQFPGGAHDDIVDTISYGTLFLTRRGAGSGRAGRAAGTEEPLQKAIVDATLRRRRPTDTRWGVVSNYSYLRQVDPYK
jgi:predicted phage terminase large subunit-like protein